MNALAKRIHRFGPPEVIELESVDLPQPAPGETLIEVRAAGVGPWDAWVRSGKSALPQPLPLTLWADVAGVVLLAGAEANHLSAGVEVHAVTDARFIGGYATHAIVDRDCRTRAGAQRARRVLHRGRDGARPRARVGVAGCWGNYG